MQQLPDLGIIYFQSDEWRLAAIFIVIVGVVVIPSYLSYMFMVQKNKNAHDVAVLSAQSKLEQAKVRRLSKEDERQ